MMLGFKASCCPLLTVGSIAWKVFSVSFRPLSPASNFMVGTQVPKSRPEMVEATNPEKVPVTGSLTAPVPLVADELEAVPAADVVADETAAWASAEAVADADLVIVMKVVDATQATWLALELATTTGADEELTAAGALDADPELAPPAAAPTVPSRAFCVKLEKP